MSKFLHRMNDSIEKARLQESLERKGLVRRPRRRKAKQPDHFPGYPHLKRVAYNDRYGRMELIEVNRTSDGYLVGMAKIGEGEDAYLHSVFLGAAR